MKKMDQYKNDQLNEKELDDFTRQIIRAKFRKEKKEKWTKKLENLHKIKREGSKSVNVWKKIRQKRFLAIAAAFLFLIISMLLIIRNASEPKAIQLAETYLNENKFPNPIATKSSQEKPSELRLNMAEAYNKENFIEAINLGEQLIKTSEAKSEDFFFLGLSYLYNNDPQNAITSLLKFRLEETKTNQFEQENRWFLALAYIKATDFEKAKQELQFIVNRKDWNANIAEQLLKALRDAD